MLFNEYDRIIIRAPSYDPGGLDYSPPERLPSRPSDFGFASGSPPNPLEWPDSLPANETLMRFIFDPDNERRIWVDRDRQDGRLEPLDPCDRCSPDIAEVYPEGEFWNEAALCGGCISDLDAALENEERSPLGERTLGDVLPPYCDE